MAPQYNRKRMTTWRTRFTCRVATHAITARGALPEVQAVN